MTTSERVLGTSWVVATVVGWAAGFIVCESIESFTSTAFSDGLVIGTGVGIAQWVVLRWREPRIHAWIVLSIVGFGIGRAGGEILAQGLPTLIGNVLNGAVIGLLVGVTQWIALRERYRAAAWWIPVSIVAWAVGWALIRLTHETASTSDVATWIVGVVGSALAGVITGGALIYLSRRTGAPLTTAPAGPA